MRRLRDGLKRGLLRAHPLLRRFVPDKHFPYRFPGGRIYLNIRESPMMLARALGLYESEKTKAVITLLRPGQTFVDVGSNKGDFSLLASKRVGTVGKVLSFEPEPTNCGWIRKSVDLNRYHNISLFEMALSDTNGEERLYLGEKSGHHTLLPGRPNRTGAAITVQKKTLDAVLDELDHPRIHMIKIDVEGAELEVLRGASDTLVANPGIIVLLDIHPQLGVNPNEICDFLEGLGFSLFRMQSPFDIPAQREARLNELLACRGAAS